MLKSGGFELRKLVSDHLKILENLDTSKLLNANVTELIIAKPSNCKVLGLQCNLSQGTLFPKVQLKPKPETKRGFWATIAQIFDPLGNLPRCHVTPPKVPFEHTGVDLFRPVYVKLCRNIVKRWDVLFACMASRGGHIEVVSDLSTDSFIQCFMCFTSRRGMYCRCIYSDQGTNFEGCDVEFKRLRKRCFMTT